MTPKNMAIASLLISLVLVGLAVLSFMEAKKQREAAKKKPCTCTEEHPDPSDATEFAGGTVHSTV